MSDKRANSRRPLNYPCWIDAGSDQPPVQCRLENVSKSGAKLVFDGTLKVANEFIVYFTRNGTVGRKCRVAWRDGNQIGFQFASAQAPLPKWSDPVVVVES